jgi:transcriptional regulator with XRE-family HTH domain
MFGARLKEKRLEAGITQKQLGEIVGVTDSMITQIERGTKQASAPLIAELATALNCTADQLIFGKGK